MRRILLVGALAACTHGTSTANPGRDPNASHTTLAVDDDPTPPYDKAALQMAIIAERAAEARNEREVSDAEVASDPDRLRITQANLAVRRRFIRILEICEATDRLCPPRLDEPVWPYPADSEEDPKLDVPLRFDLGSWQKVTTELHGRACACRTLACIDSMDAEIGRLETRPIEDVQADDTAIAELTGARECLLRLRGRKRMPRVATE